MCLTMNDGDPAAMQETFGLKPGVSFCRVDGRTVFLDMPEDRYSCLSPAGEAAFGRLVEGDPIEPQHLAALTNVARTGPLASGASSTPIAPCRAIEPPGQSLLDSEATPSLLGTGSAAASLIAAPLRLRLRGLAATLRWLERRKARATGNVAIDRLARSASAFARLRLIATEKDNCLTRSIAVASRLIALGATPDLVIAVKLQPFYAHAWVQCDGWLVNDRHEFVRNYTPILVV